MSPPYMPFYPGDYLRDTAHLSLEEHGAYMLLIMHYWSHGGLPSDYESIRNLSYFRSIHGNRFRSIWKAIAPFFDERGHHKRIDAELEKCRKISEKRALAGAVGGSRSRGLTNNGRYLNGANAKQTGGIHTIRDNYLPSTEPRARAEGPKARQELVTSSLEESIRRRGWAAPDPQVQPSAPEISEEPTP